MEASLWVSKTGLDAQQTRMTVISNNLANVNTVGFKKDRAVFCNGSGLRSVDPNHFDLGFQDDQRY